MKTPTTTRVRWRKQRNSVLSRRPILVAIACVVFGTVMTYAVAWWQSLTWVDSLSASSAYSLKHAHLVPMDKAEKLKGYVFDDCECIMVLKIYGARADIRAINVRCYAGNCQPYSYPRSLTDFSLAKLIPMLALNQSPTTNQDPRIRAAFGGWGHLRGTRYRPQSTSRPGSVFPDLRISARQAQRVPYSSNEFAAGWPFRSHWMYVDYLREGDPWVSSIVDRSSLRVHGAITFSPPKSRSLFVNDPILTQRALPLLPIWRGLIFNVAVYSALPLVVLVVRPLVIRVIRTRRASRGRCVACGYDLAGISGDAGGEVICPECGDGVVQG